MRMWRDIRLRILPVGQNGRTRYCDSAARAVFVEVFDEEKDKAIICIWNFFWRVTELRFMF